MIFFIAHFFVYICLYIIIYMEKFEVTILGCGSALPTTRHFASAQVVNLREKLYLIDCGEGCQLQFRRSRLNFSRLNHIFISHLHGDHCFGLMGLISTLGLLGRTAPMHLYAPYTFEEQFRTQMHFFCKGLSFDVEFHPVDTSKHDVIYEDRTVTVYSLPLRHRIECCGFLFKEKPLLPHIRKDMIDFYHIPTYEINNIKNGKDWVTEDGTVVPHHRLTFPADAPRSYAYCSDTCYLPKLAEYLQNVDLLFHEATFAHDNAARAKETFHTTALEAGKMAAACHAKQLCIGHFSARYEDENVLLREAQKEFSNTILAKENLTIQV